MPTRNLYRILCGSSIAAFISATSEAQAQALYRQRGGKLLVTAVERISNGFPQNLFQIYA